MMTRVSNRSNQRGAAVLEFGLATLTLIPLLLGGLAIGINVVRALQNSQLARSAGHLFARGLDFSQPGNQTILASIGSSLGLSTTPGTGAAQVILVHGAFSHLRGADACRSQGLSAGGNELA